MQFRYVTPRVVLLVKSESFQNDRAGVCPPLLASSPPPPDRPPPPRIATAVVAAAVAAAAVVVAAVAAAVVAAAAAVVVVAAAALTGCRGRRPPPLPRLSTSYARALNDRLALPLLRRSLAALFAPHGRVLFILAGHARRMRG